MAAEADGHVGVAAGDWARDERHAGPVAQVTAVGGPPAASRAGRGERHRAVARLSAALPQPLHQPEVLSSVATKVLLWLALVVDPTPCTNLKSPYHPYTTVSYINYSLAFTFLYALHDTLHLG